jgi:hypothetical protein
MSPLPKADPDRPLPDYLMALQQHAAAVLKAPQSWLPWNFQQAIAAAGCGLLAGVPRPATSNRRNPAGARFLPLRKPTGATRCAQIKTGMPTR